MEKNEIKKALYKENPTAVMEYVGSGHVKYVASLNELGLVGFTVPFEEIADTAFYSQMEAKLLIRWLI